MSEEQRILIEEARKKYNRIYPCGSSRTLSESFTTFDKEIVLWFNTEDGSTHMIKSEISTN